MHRRHKNIHHKDQLSKKIHPEIRKRNPYISKLKEEDEVIK
jgi:hypothetical protein